MFSGSDIILFEILSCLVRWTLHHGFIYLLISCIKSQFSSLTLFNDIANWSLSIEMRARVITLETRIKALRLFVLALRG